MLARSHMALGCLGGCVFKIVFDVVADNLKLSNETFYTIIFPIIIIGSLFPDIDEPRSFIGRKLPVLSHIISLSFTHRGFTHFLVFPLIFIIAGIIILPTHQFISICLFAFGYGIFLHQVGDMLTKSGIPYYFFPFSKTKAVLLPQNLRFRTGGKVESVILYLVLLPIIALIGAEKTNIDLPALLQNIMSML